MAKPMEISDDKLVVHLWLARWNQLDFAPMESFHLDGVIGDYECRSEYAEFRANQGDEGFYDAVILLTVQFCESLVDHGLIILIT